MKGGKFISVNNFSAQEHASSKKQAHFKFQSYGGAWHKARNVFVDKCMLVSGFLAFLEVKVLEKVLI